MPVQQLRIQDRRSAKIAWSNLENTKMWMQFGRHGSATGAAELALNKVCWSANLPGFEATCYHPFGTFLGLLSFGSFVPFGGYLSVANWSWQRITRCPEIGQWVMWGVRHTPDPPHSGKLPRPAKIPAIFPMFRRSDNCIVQYVYNHLILPINHLVYHSGPGERPEHMVLRGASVNEAYRCVSFRAYEVLLPDNTYLTV